MSKGKIIFLNGVTSAGKTSIVEVYCPLEICRARNIARGDRYENQSQEQHELMAENIRYSMRVDTSVLSSVECAEQIVKGLM